MAKVTLTNLVNLQNENTAVSAINANSAAVAAAVENTLSRDGTAPNQMLDNLDMNNKQILNLPVPSNPNSPLRLKELVDFVGGGTIASIPGGGTTGQVLTKQSNTNYDTNWSNSVTSVGMAMPADLTVTNSPVTTTGTLTANWATTPTGTGAMVRKTSPALVTPDIGSATGAALQLSGLTASQSVATDASKNLVSVPVTGTGNNVLQTSPTLVTPTIGAATATSLNVTGLTASSAVATDASKNLTSVTNTGTGNNVLATSPTLVTPSLGTPSALTLTNATGLPLSTGVTGTLQASNHPALTGDVTNTAGSVATTIANSVVTNAKMANMAAYTLKGNNSGSSAAPGDIDISLLTTKASPNTGDYVMISDQSASGAWKKVTVGSVGSAGSVASFNGRTGAVVATAADYTAAQIGANGAFYKTVVQKFTASGTYTPSTGMVHCIVECLGGGGGGGGLVGLAVGAASGGGGGAGSYSRAYLTAAAIGASKTVTIGAAGSGGAAGNNSGTAGGDTSLGTLCVGKGGSGGGNSPSAGGAGGVAGTGDITGVGMNGQGGVYLNATGMISPSAVGGSTQWGAGGLSVVANGGALTGLAGTGYGSGGSGGGTQTSTSSVGGGNGAPGLCIVTEFCNQ